MAQPTKAPAPEATLAHLAAAVAAPALGQDAYLSAVRLVAASLRPWFSTGQFRRASPEDTDRVERACSDLFIRQPESAVFVLRFASRAGRNLLPFQWQVPDPTCLRGSAEVAMAHDVLACARAQGWLRARPSRKPKSAGQRASVRHGRAEGVA